jgi:predicted dehydrogenase
MTVAAELRVGIVGAGAVACDRHLPGLRGIDGVDVRAVANRTARSSQRAAQELDVPVAYGSWEELVADPELDAVVVGTWPDSHATITTAALAAGKHVLTEGRMAMDHTEARVMLAASLQRPDRVAMVVPAAVTFWADRTVQRLLDEGSVGRLLAVKVQWGGTSPRRQHPAWRRDRRRSGNNVMELGILVESVARWVGHPVWVQAVERIIDTRAVEAPDGFVADVPDYLAVQGELPGSVALSMEMSPHLLHAGPRSVTMFGTAGTLHVDLEARRLSLATDGDNGTAQTVPTAAESQDWRVEAEFVGAIRGEEPIRLNDLATAERYMAVTDTVRDAARTGRRSNVA